MMFSNIKNEIKEILKNKIIILLSVLLILFAIVSPFMVKRSIEESQNISNLIPPSQYETDIKEPIYQDLVNALNADNIELIRVLESSGIKSDNLLGILASPELGSAMNFKVLANYYNNGVKRDALSNIYQEEVTLAKLDNYIAADDQKKASLLAENEENINLYKKVLLENNYKLYNEKFISTLNIDIQKLEQEKNSIVVNEENGIKIKELESLINSNKETIDILNYRNSSDISYDTTNWKNNAITTIESYIKSKNTIEFTKEEFENQYSDSYDSYLEMTTKEKKIAENNYLIAKDALENNKENSFLNSNQNIQQNLMTSMNIFVNTSYLAIIIILIKFFSLYKKFKLKEDLTKEIVISRISSITIYTYGIGLIGYVLNNVIFGVLFGISGITHSIPVLIRDNITNINFILYVIPRLLSCILPIIFLISLSLLLLFIVKNAILSTILVFLFKLITRPIALMLFGFDYMAMNIFSFTPFAYLDLYQIYDIQSSFNGFSIMNNIGGIKGSIVLIIYTIIILAIVMKNANKKSLEIEETHND